MEVSSHVSIIRPRCGNNHSLWCSYRNSSSRRKKSRGQLARRWSIGGIFHSMRPLTPTAAKQPLATILIDSPALERTQSTLELLQHRAPHVAEQGARRIRSLGLAPQTPPHVQLLMEPERRVGKDGIRARRRRLVRAYARRIPAADDKELGRSPRWGKGGQ